MIYSVHTLLCSGLLIIWKLKYHNNKYEVWQKSNETDFLLTKVFIFFNHQCYLLQNSSLGQLHTDGDVVSTFGSSAGSQPVWPSTCSLHSFGYFLKSRNDSLSWRNKFCVDDSSSVKKTNQHWFDLRFDHWSFLWSRRARSVPLLTLSLGLRIVLKKSMIHHLWSHD